MKHGFNHSGESSYIGKDTVGKDTTGGTPTPHNQSTGADMTGNKTTPCSGKSGTGHLNQAEGTVKPS